MARCQWKSVIRKLRVTSSPNTIFNFIIYDKDGAPSFKGDDGKTEILEVEKGTVEKRLLCAVRPDWPGYRWFKNGRIIEVRANRKKYRIKKYRYLKIKNIMLSDEGIYVCQSYNSEENYVNKTVYLNVVAGRSTSSSSHCNFIVGQNSLNNANDSYVSM